MEERPVECSQCQKPIETLYTEIVGKEASRVQMCADCPVLHHKLHGDATPSTLSGPEKESGLCCNKCQTSLESVKMGEGLGCPECYSVFESALVQELKTGGNIASQVIVAPKRTLHVGKSPMQGGQMITSERLSTLNQALNEALRKENYEQAAYLRDQIKHLTDKQEE